MAVDYDDLMRLARQLQHDLQTVAPHDSSVGPDDLFQPGAVITAAELNDIIAALIERLLHHDHSGNTDDEINGPQLDGDALANDSIGQQHLQTDSVGHEQLRDNSVGPDELQDDAVESRHIADDAVQGDHVADDVITVEHLHPSVLALLDGDGGASTYGYCCYLTPQQTVVGEATAASTAIDVKAVDGVDGPVAEQPAWWNLVFDGRDAVDVQIPVLSYDPKNPGPIEQAELQVHDGWFTRRRKTLPDKAGDELVIDGRLLYAAKMGMISESDGTLVKAAEGDKSPVLLGKATATNNDSQTETTTGEAKTLAQKAGADSTANDAPMLLDGRTIEIMAEVLKGPGDGAIALLSYPNHFERSIAGLQAEPWNLSKANIARLNDLPTTKQLSSEALFSGIAVINELRYQGRSASRFTAAGDEAIAGLGGKAALGQAAYQLSLLIELLRFSALPEEELVVLETALLHELPGTPPIDNKEAWIGGDLSRQAPEAITAYVQNRRAALKKAGIGLIPMLGAEPAEQEPEPPQIDDYDAYRAFIDAGLAREVDAGGGSRFISSRVYQRKRHALRVEHRSTINSDARGSFLVHPGVGDSDELRVAARSKGLLETVLGKRGEKLAARDTGFTPGGDPGDFDVQTAATVFQHFGLGTRKSLLAWLKEHRLTHDQADWFNQLVRFPGGYVTCGCRNIASVTRRQMSGTLGRWFVRVSFEKAYAAADYRVSLCSEEPRESSAAAVLAPRVLARATDHIDIGFHPFDAASSCIPFSISIDGQLKDSR